VRKITDKNYNDIVDGVYNVDAGKVKRPWRDDKIFKSNGQTFRVLKTEDNTSNGMQAMEVVPINKVTGQVDHRHKYDVIGNVVGNEKKKLFMLYYKAIIG
jgi:hypothetical protein